VEEFFQTVICGASQPIKITERDILQLYLVMIYSSLPIRTRRRSSLRFLLIRLFQTNSICRHCLIDSERGTMMMKHICPLNYLGSMNTSFSTSYRFPFSVIRSGVICRETLLSSLVRETTPLSAMLWHSEHRGIKFSANRIS